MGNGLAKLTHCFSCGGSTIRRRHGAAAVSSEPYDEGLGHSFCYVRPDPPAAGAASSKVHHHSEEATTFRSISGASVSANASTPLSTSLLPELLTCPTAAAFESSTSFSSVPLQPVPRFASGPLSGPLAASDRGFLSGPIERGFMSGPLDHRAALFSAPLDKPLPAGLLRRSLSLRPRTCRVASSLLRGLTKAIGRTISAPVLGSKELGSGGRGSANPSGGASDQMSTEVGEASDSFSSQAANLQWAQGKAGEDRVHVVISEEHEWVFVGIYDGFNGPDATDYLLSNLYSAVQRELKGLLWDDKYDDGHRPSDDPFTAATATTEESDPTVSTIWEGMYGCIEEGRQGSGKRRKFRGSAKLDRRLKEQLGGSSSPDAVNHWEVLKALSQALRKTEEAYLDIADKMVSENPELALMGSCVLVMLMKTEDVYLMNVGDCRAVVVHTPDHHDPWGSMRKPAQDLARISEEIMHDIEAYGGINQIDGLTSLAAQQLTMDHSTCVEEEIRRIRNEHPEDSSAVVNDHVKGSLKVTRAFGAGFLKQPKWNNALLEMFRIDYVGTSPYITFNPYLRHHSLGPKDRFLILSSYGLYQYFTNEEAVAHVELFFAMTAEGDPAQYLVEEVLFRAAEKAGMDFHELLEIPQGDWRRYHDDVSISHLIRRKDMEILRVNRDTE